MRTNNKLNPHMTPRSVIELGPNWWEASALTTAPSLLPVIGSLSNDDGNGNENVRRKYIFISFVLLRDYFNTLNFYKNGELSRNQIDRSGVLVKKDNEKFTVVRSRSPQNLKCGHFTFFFCRGRQRNVPKCKTHVQSDCFCSLNLLFCGVVVSVAVVVA